MNEFKMTLVWLVVCLSCAPAFAQEKPLILFQTTEDQYGYVGLEGDTIIRPGKYAMCFTDTFRTFAVVAARGGLIAIDRKERMLYHVFPYDNGPDYPADGLFRIERGSKIGYADAATGNVIIKPQFTCAFPFEQGKAKVAKHCSTIAEGEHQSWVSDDWFYIDKQGRPIKSD